jgi:hypothetical protein
MRTGYLALFSVVVAYSAYQSMDLSEGGAPRQPPAVVTIGAEVDRPVRSYANQAEALPTIGGGICRLTVDGVPSPTCGDCNAICAAKDLGKLIEDYFRAEPGGDKKFLAAHWNVPHAKQSQIKFVIATLPDPVHTHMGLLFDRGIDAIQRAAQASGYLFSRAWMPWDISAHTESTDFTVRMAQTKFRDELETLPGLLIFQASGNNENLSSILFVFVVGETATGGLHTEQFQNALKIRQAMLADAAGDVGETRVLRVFGPSFSGSLSSLNAILGNQQPHSQFSSIQIRSGTVSSYHAVHDFCESSYLEWPETPAAKANDESIGRPDFATFQFSDAYQEYYLSAFFNRRHNLHSRVAILSEDETAFGNQEKSKAPVSAASDQCGAAVPPPMIEFVRLYFPREIAQLREAYQRDVRSQAAAIGAKPAPQSGLPLSLSVTGNDDDSVAPYSPLQTPLSQESILQSIVATLRREHAKVVVIRATDPLDAVFLSRYLRQNYPQARLVTVGVDLLMIHDFYDPRFHGILALSPYPLLTGAEFPQLKSASGERNLDVHRLFPDSYSIGDFNAFESLLAPPAKISTLLPAADYAEFGLPSFLDQNENTHGFWRAHLWLTAVGREGYWPVAVLDDDDPNLIPQGRVPESSIRNVDASYNFLRPFSVSFSIGWTILWTIAVGLVVFLAFLLAYPHVFARSEILARFGGCPSEERNRMLFAGTLLVLATETLFVLPILVWLKRFGFVWQGLRGLSTGMEVGIICYEMSVVLLGFCALKGFRARNAEALARAVVVVCAAAIVLTLGLTFSNWPGKASTQLGAFVYRYIEVGSGVSPLLPLLFVFAAWIWWCWQSLTGIASTDEKQMILPDAKDFDGDVSLEKNVKAEKLVPDASDRIRLKSLSSQVNRCLWRILGAVPLGDKKKILIVASLAFGLIYLWMRPDEIAEAFEFRKYKILYWTFLYSGLFLVCYLGTHIVALWLEFRTLLRAIDRMSFRRGFRDLKDLTWKPLWKLAGSGRQDFVQLLDGELDSLRQIQNCGAPEDLKTAIESVLDAEKSVAAEYEKMLDGTANCKTPLDVQRLFHDLQKTMAAIASKSLIYANQQWKRESYTPPEPGKTRKSESNEAPISPQAGDPKTRTVEHFLCLFYVNVILVPLRRLQTLILALAGAFVFVSLSYSSYPFESRESFHVLLISIFFAISLIVGIVYGQMYANPLLSLITNTNPGELGLDFWVRLGTFVFIPLLSLVSVQFPEVNNFLFSWLQPALQSIK